MAFSFFGILSVLLEVLRPLLPFILLVLLVNIVLLAIAAKRGALVKFGPALRAAAAVAAVMFLLVLVFAPLVTGASHGQLTGALDWLALLAAACGIGLLSATIAWPPLQLWLGRA